MRIALGYDHAGFGLKQQVIDILTELGHQILDRGAPEGQFVDFPDVTFVTCDLVRRSEAERAVLVCGTGVGAVMAANKIPGIRATIGHDVFSAHQSVEHDNANVIAMGAWLIGPGTAREVLVSFLKAEFDDDEDTNRRVRKLGQLEMKAARELGYEE